MIVTPLIKKPSLAKDDLKNYWPVSGLNFISKVIERVVAKIMKSFMNSSNSLPWTIYTNPPISLVILRG